MPPTSKNYNRTDNRRQYSNGVIGAAPPRPINQLTAALDIARHYPIFPCHGIVNGRCTCGDTTCGKPGKHPHITSFFEKATKDETAIRGWWGKWPNANIGIPTGQRSGIFVVEVDPRHHGDENLAGLEAKHSKLPITQANTSGSGGTHYYFDHPGAHVRAGQAGTLGEGIDVKSDGGYVIAAGSNHHSGGTYTHKEGLGPNDVGLAGAPNWVLTALLTASASKNGRGKSVPLPSVIPDGRLHDALVSLAGALRRIGVSDEGALALFRAENEGRAEIPASEEKLREIWVSTVGWAATHDYTQDGPQDGDWAGEVLASNVVPTVTKWLWEGRIPLGTFTMMDGDPGVGKSTIGLDVGARVSGGEEMPDGTPGIEGGAGVVIVSAEDDPASTIVPRLIAAGADLTQIIILQSVKDENGKPRPPTVGDIDAIKHAIKSCQAKLLLLDPAMAHLPVEVSSYSDQEIRRAFYPFKGLAESTGVAVLMIRHLNKDKGTNAKHRGGGSMALLALCRAGLLAGVDPTDPAETRHILAQTKSNLAKPAPSMAYHIVGTDDGHSRIVWDGKVDYRARDLLAEPERDASEKAPLLHEAVGFLAGFLGGGEQLASDVKDGAKAEGIASSTLWDAKEYLGVHSRRDGFGKGSRCYWVPMQPQDPGVGIEDTEL